jgi:hypothetical protein
MIRLRRNVNTKNYPADARMRHRPSRLTMHLLRIGAYAGVVFWLALVYLGWVLVSGPPTGWHSYLIGWVALAGAGLLMVVTMGHWVKYLRFVLGGLTLGALFAVVDGHLLNRSVPFPRLVAIELSALSAGCGLISHTLATRRLATFDRVMLVGFVAVVVGLFKGSEAAVVGLAFGFVFLLAAWARDRRAGRAGGPETVS